MSESEIVIRECAVDDVRCAANIDAIMAEYAIESSIAGMPEAQAQWGLYANLEASGVLHVLGAFQGGNLAGALFMLVAVLPHYGAKVASTESFFVPAAMRKGGAGAILLREAERIAKELGAVGFLMSAPLGGRLAKAAPLLGFRETNRVFFKEL